MHSLDLGLAGHCADGGLTEYLCCSRTPLLKQCAYSLRHQNSQMFQENLAVASQAVAAMLGLSSDTGLLRHSSMQWLTCVSFTPHLVAQTPTAALPVPAPLLPSGGWTAHQKLVKLSPAEAARHLACLGNCSIIQVAAANSMLGVSSGRLELMTTTSCGT